jgi:hypothetical protein
LAYNLKGTGCLLNEIMKRKYLAISAVLIGLTSCNVGQPVEDVDPSNPNCICTMEYDPVCVQGNGEILRYSNACQAMCDGFDQDDFINCPPE